MAQSPQQISGRFLFVTNDAWFFVSHRLAIAEALIARGAEVHVVAKPDTSVPEIEKAGAVFHPWHMEPRNQSLFRELFSFLHLTWLILRIRPKVLHLVTIKAVLYGGVIARLLMIKYLVIAVSGLGALLQPDDVNSQRAPLRIVYRFALNHSRCRVIFQNESNRRTLFDWLRLSAPSVIIRGSGVDTELFSYSVEPDNSELQVTLAARLLKDKGVSEFVEAASIFNSTVGKVRFIVAGGAVAQGNPASYTEEELEQLRSSPSVDFIGHQSDIKDLYTRSNIVVLPSYHEGFPKTLVEAGACGRAVVTTDVPGCRDAVLPGESAILVPPRDAVKLAEAVGLLVGDRDLRIRMGKIGRAYVEDQLSIETVVLEHLKLYEEILVRRAAD